MSRNIDGDPLAGRCRRAAPDQRARASSRCQPADVDAGDPTPSAMRSSPASMTSTATNSATPPRRAPTHDEHADSDVIASIASRAWCYPQSARRPSVRTTPRRTVHRLETLTARRGNPRSPTMADMNSGVVIVGGGIAGQAVCEALRERDATSPITLVCGEASAPYDRVRLSEILVSGEDPETLQLRPAEWYADHDVELLVGRRVTWVDAERGVLGLDDVDELALRQARRSRPARSR